jgi:hypothetical protein
MRVDSIILALVKKRLREQVEAGRNSGTGRPLTARRVPQLKARALGKRRSSPNT